MKYYLSVIKDNYANFEGRARRMEYWMFTLFHIIIIFVLAFLSGVFADVTETSIPLIILAVYFIATIIPSIAVTVRRLHDTGKSGWWYLITFVPYVGGLILFIFTLFEGDTGPNQYGADPKKPNFEIEEIGKPRDF